MTTETTETGTGSDEQETIDALAAAQALLGEAGTEEADPMMVEEEDPSPILPGVEVLPPVVPQTLDPNPPRRPGKKKPPNKKNPFASMVGAGERLLIHKRDPQNGQLTYVGQYSPEDLMRSGNVDVFLQEYIVPTWKEGEFQLTLQATDGTLKPQGSRKIGAPPGSQGSGSNTETSLKELVELQQKMDEKAKNEGMEEMKNMVTMMTALKAMNPSKEGAAPDPMASMMPMMMMMMMMNKQPSGPDPMLMMLMSKLDRADDTPPPMTMPMLPAPAADTSMTDLAALITALKPTGQSTSTQDLIAMAQMLKGDDGEKITVKDLITLAPTLKDMFSSGDKPGSFRETVENLGMLQNITQGMQPDEGGFWEFASQLVGNLPALTEAINAKKNGTALATPAAATAAAPSKTGKKVPPIPAGFDKFAEKMMKASEDDDEGALIEQCLRGMMFLREKSPQWKPYVEACITFASREEQEKSMKYIEVFLQTFLDKKHIDAECANSTYQAFEDHWEQVLVSLGLKKAEDVEPEEDPDSDGDDEGDGDDDDSEGVRVVSSETVAEAEQSEIDAEVEDDDSIEMSDEEIAALAAQSEVVESEDMGAETGEAGTEEGEEGSTIGVTEIDPKDDDDPSAG